jgi:hypothetical protein
MSFLFFCSYVAYVKIPTLPLSHELLFHHSFVSRARSDARVIDRTCDLLRSLPPVNCESPYVESTIETY